MIRLTTMAIQPPHSWRSVAAATIQTTDADLTISINERCRTYDLNQTWNYQGEQLFSKFQNGALPIPHLQICDLLENHRLPTGHFRFELATFSDKNRQVHRNTSPVPIISYGIISPTLAINLHGDKSTWQ